MISANCLVRNFDETLALVEEILLEPRWDEEEFARIKIKTINEIKRSDANPNVVAGRVYNKILYGKNHIFSYPTSGTVASVEAITMEDLKAFYYKNFSPSISNFHVVGAITEVNSKKSLASLSKNWEAKKVVIPYLPFFLRYMFIFMGIL